MSPAFRQSNICEHRSEPHVSRGGGAAATGANDGPWLPGNRQGVVVTDVDSPHIATMIYSRDGGALQVRLRNGCAYCYRGVPRRKYEALKRSKCVERYLHRNIKKIYGETEIDRPGIREVHIRNFRSIRDMTVRLGDLTVLIGANGTGKTTVLDALELFLSRRPTVNDEDYYLDSGQIDITVDVNPGCHAVSKKFLRNGTIRLKRSFAKNAAGEGRTLMAEALHNEDFGNDPRGMTAQGRFSRHC